MNLSNRLPSAIALLATAFLTACSSASSAPEPAKPNQPQIDYINSLQDSFAVAQCADSVSKYGCLFTTKGVVTGHFASKILVDTFHNQGANIRVGTGGEFLDSADGAAFVDKLLKGSGVDATRVVKDTTATWYQVLVKAGNDGAKPSLQYIWSGKGNGLSKVFSYDAGDGDKVTVVVTCLVGLLVNFDTNCEITMQKS